ncbi:hypothetical protein WG66_000073 [Moniliophthora roreri]|nr:hypothetical protein WG66_000073 [Moniliophthora roreri]
MRTTLNILISSSFRKLAGHVFCSTYQAKTYYKLQIEIAFKIMVLTLLRPLDLLRNPFKLRTFISPPIRSVLRWTRLTRKPSKLAKKTSIRRIAAPSLTKQFSRPQISLPAPPARKRIRVRGTKSILKRKPLPRVRARPLKKDQAQAQCPVTPARARAHRVPVTPVINHLVTLSVNDLHKATKRAFHTPAFGNGKSANLTFQDKLFMEQVKRASDKHTFISGIADVQSQLKLIDPEQRRKEDLEHEVVAQRLRAERKAREEEMTRAEELREQEEEAERRRVEERKAVWAKNILAARAEELTGTNQQPTTERESSWSQVAPLHERATVEAPLNARIAHDRWTLYDLRWDIFLGDRRENIPSAISFSDLPWPTMQADSMTYIDVESFFLSPIRPGYQTLDWKQRIDKEVGRWSDFASMVFSFVKSDGDDRGKTLYWASFVQVCLEKMREKWGEGLVVAEAASS